MKYSVPVLIFFLITALSCSDNKDYELVENTGYAQGSTFQIKYYSPGGQDYSQDIDSILKTIDKSMSTWDSTSIITKVNTGNIWVAVDKPFIEVLKRSIEIAEETNGQFDPTIGPLVELWGFSFKEVSGDISDENVEDVMKLIGYESISISDDSIKIPAGFSIDFNAIAQGYTVDEIALHLEDKGVSSYMAEVGGEVRTKGSKEDGSTWKIGVDKPQEQIDATQRFQFIVELKDAALATSGSYRKFWVDEETGLRYSHTIDPGTGKPAMNTLLSASLIADNAMDADAYATACMVKGLDECIAFLESKERLEAYLVYSEENGDWGEYITDGFKEMIVE